MATRPAPPVPSSGRSKRDLPPGATEPRSRPKPRIGQYIIERTLGTGSFGKVKRKSAVAARRTSTDTPSRNPCHNRPPGRPQAHQSQQDHHPRHERTRKARNPVPQGPSSPAHYQAVSGGGGVGRETDPSYEVITTPTDVIMVMEYAGEELFNYIVAKGKGGVS